MNEHLSHCIETEGKNVDEAVQNALSRLGVQRDDVDIDVLDKGSRGAFGFLGSRPARVRVRLKNVPRPPVDPEKLVKELLAFMGFSCTVLCTDTNDSLEVSLGPTSADGLLIGKRGETLECLQHVVSKMVNRDASNWKHVSVDVGGYRKRRESQLVKLANSLADRVSSSGQEISTEPLKAFERRVIHVTLRDHPAVRSFAVGEGFVKRVVIGPKDDGRA
ncbi:MAG: RNA-binding cell elongation regulator Jag/EloR [Candidatus Eisenbacteria bacterium]